MGSVLACAHLLVAYSHYLDNNCHGKYNLTAWIRKKAVTYERHGQIFHINFQDF